MLILSGVIGKLLCVLEFALSHFCRNSHKDRLLEFVHHFTLCQGMLNENVFKFVDCGVWTKQNYCKEYDQINNEYIAGSYALYRKEDLNP